MPELRHSIHVAQATSWTELVQRAFPLVYCLGPYLACNTVLMGKLVRLAKSFIEKVRRLYLYIHTHTHTHTHMHVQTYT